LPLGDEVGGDDAKKLVAFEDPHREQPSLAYPQIQIFNDFHHDLITIA
jgi:hypothetical protein